MPATVNADKAEAYVNKTEAEKKQLRMMLFVALAAAAFFFFRSRRK